MKKLYYCIVFLSITIGFISCTATNNLYMHNPIPVGKGKGIGFVGLGTGTEAKIDSISDLNGAVYSSGKIGITPALSLGFQAGISNQTDLRFAIHFPKILGGVGLRLGAQHSFLEADAKINIAFGFDLGYAFSDDSIKIFGTNNAINKGKNGVLNADIFLPVSFKLKEDVILIIAPRYSLNAFYIRKFRDAKKSVPFKPKYPALSLGLWIKQYYFEATAIFYNNNVYPHFGVATYLK